MILNQTEEIKRLAELIHIKKQELHRMTKEVDDKILAEYIKQTGIVVGSKVKAREEEFIITSIRPILYSGDKIGASLSGKKVLKGGKQGKLSRYIYSSEIELIKET
ncbi:MAG: hypothetical protein ACYC97_05580 [Metallibacterium sp.]